MGKGDFVNVKPISLEDRHKAIDEMQKSCDEQLNKTIEAIKKSKNNSQKIQSLMIELSAQQKCKNDAIDALQWIQTIESDQRKAMDLINRRLDQCQTTASLMLGAVMSASGQYDNILQTKAEKPLLETVLTDVIISFLPELKITERVFNRLIKEKVQSKELIASLEKIYSKKFLDDVVKTNYDRANKVRERFLEVGRTVDKIVVKDAVRSAKNTVSANNKADAESRLRDMAFQAKNQVFQQAISSIMYKLVEYSFNAIKLYDTVPYFDQGNAEKNVKSVMETFGMEEMEIPQNPTIYDTLSDQLLYSMLRAYTSRYCSITLTTYGAAQSGSSVGANDDIDGLNKSQRQMIYDKFGSKVWNGKPGYPSVDNTLDLVNRWGVNVIRRTWDPILGERIIEQEIV